MLHSALIGELWSCSHENDVRPQPRVRSVFNCLKSSVARGGCHSFSLYRAAQQACSLFDAQPLWSLALIGWVAGKKMEVSRGNLREQEMPVYVHLNALSDIYQPFVADFTCFLCTPSRNFRLFMWISGSEILHRISEKSKLSIHIKKQKENVKHSYSFRLEFT